MALRDPLVASEMEKTVLDWISWQGPDGYRFWRVETLMLQARALAAVVDDGEVDVEALRAWLPRVDDLICIAEREFHSCFIQSGATHPALLCATLYATHLGAWNDAEAVVKGVLAIPPLGDGKGFGMQPLVRIEAWRLLARCRGACGDTAGAWEALEHAASESRAVGYVWMEAASLRDMLEFVEGNAEVSSRRLQTRIDGVMELSKRATALGQTTNQPQVLTAADKDPASHTPDAAKYDMLLNGAVAQWMQAAQTHGYVAYTPLTLAALSQSYAEWAEAMEMFENAALVAPDSARRSYAVNVSLLHGSFPRLHLLPEFDQELITGKGCSKLRKNIEEYDFDAVHAECKSFGVALDIYLYGHNEAGLLHFNGDVETAKAGWRKQIEARKQMVALVEKGERKWGEYISEEVQFCYSILVGGMLAAGEMGMVRELIPHTWMGMALRDPLVASEMEKSVLDWMVSWQGPDGYRFWRVETLMLQARALAAVVDDGEVDVEALRAWLPRVDDRMYITEHEFHSCLWQSGATHPALLCATLYATHLGAWDDAEAVVKGVLAIPPLGDGKGFGMQPLVRIEAWRLLGRCRGACGDTAGAWEALEHAASESRAVGYVWMEAASLRDMLEWVEGDAEKASVHMRIAAVTSGFRTEKC